ncbi:MAG: hypothetical protein M3498_01605 [Deinococcota bacterium]|nr:hypothetical protein [Deinococcota bacterium]MDQ3457992.1 hypothetical protein [Deinococcota bacterium]
MSLPRDYKPLVRAAIRGELPHRVEIQPGRITHDLNQHVLGGLGAWAFGDEAEGLKRLELAYRALQGPGHG